jgi:mono/diheme cytochrome c family protein
MKLGYLVGIALAAAAAVAACDAGPTDTLSNGEDGEVGGNGGGKGKGGSKGGGDQEGDAPGAPASPGTENPGPSGPVPTNSSAGKEFYKTQVHPFLSQQCAGCHQTQGPGPAWITANDAEKSYAQLLQVGYVVRQSRIVLKPAHGGVTNNVLSPAQAQTYNQWVEMELKERGDKAPPNVLEKLGSCFDRQKFDAMQMGQWRTTRRTAANNTNNVTPWNENANNCTGCDNAPCSTCHSADPATNFINAVGNPVLGDSATHTFEQTKLTNPAYITKFFGTSPEGKPIASDGIKKKSEATMKDKAYTHPMYRLTDRQQAALDAFVQDVIQKYNAGTCGK